MGQMIRLQFLQRAVLKKIKPEYPNTIQAINKAGMLYKKAFNCTDPTYEPRPGHGLICTCKLSTN